MKVILKWHFYKSFPVALTHVRTGPTSGSICRGRTSTCFLLKGHQPPAVATRVLMLNGHSLLREIPLFIFTVFFMDRRRHLFSPLVLELKGPKFCSHLVGAGMGWVDGATQLAVQSSAASGNGLLQGFPPQMLQSQFHMLNSSFRGPQFKP